MVINKVLRDAFYPFKGKQCWVWPQGKPKRSLYISHVTLTGLGVKPEWRGCIVTFIPFSEIQKITEVDHG